MGIPCFIHSFTFNKHLTDSQSEVSHEQFLSVNSILRKQTLQLKIFQESELKTYQRSYTKDNKYVKNKQTKINISSS